MTEPKFMQLCRDNPGKPFPALDQHFSAEAVRVYWLEDVWLVRGGSWHMWLTDEVALAARFADPKPKPKRRFDCMDPNDGDLAGNGPGHSLAELVVRAKESGLYTQVVEVVLYAVNEDGTRGELLYGMPEVD